MIQRIKHIWKRTLTHRSEVIFIYFCQLVFGLIIGCISYSIIHDHIGQSMALSHLASGFDRTVIMDMINSNDEIFSKVSFWAMILIPLYLILSTVLQGGLLNNIKKGEIGIRSQLQNGFNLLLPFLGLALLSIILILLFTVIVGFPYKAIVGDPLTTFSSEKPFVHSLMILISLLSILIIAIWGFSISVRYNYIDGSSFWESIKHGVSFIKDHLIKIFSIGYLLIGMHLLLALLYYLIMGDRGASSWLMVLLGISVQQLFSFIRIILRSFGYICIDQIDDEFIG